MLHRAVDAHDFLPGDRQRRLHHGALRTLPACAVADDVHDAAARDEGDVELHRLLGVVALEHEEGADIQGCHEVDPPFA